MGWTPPLRWLINTTILAHRCRRGASTPSAIEDVSTGVERPRSGRSASTIGSHTHSSVSFASEEVICAVALKEERYVLALVLPPEKSWLFGQQENHNVRHRPGYCCRHAARKR